MTYSCAVLIKKMRITEGRRPHKLTEFAILLDIVAMGPNSQILS